MPDSISRLPFAFGLASLLFLRVWAETVQADLWKVPSGVGTDLQQSFTNGDILPVTWNKLATTPYLDTTNNLVDLWVTAWPPTSTLPASVAAFNQLLKANINLTASGGVYQWTIAIPAEELAVTPEYVLRFKIANPTYDPNSDELSSLGFLILQPAAKTSSTLSATSASSSSTSTTSTTAAAETSSTNKSPASSGLSGGAKAGIAIGVVVLVLGAAALVYFFFMAGRRKGMASQAQISGPQSGTNLVDKPGYTTQPVELQEQWEPPAELHGGYPYQDNPSELPAR